jgi:hypothetical protein
MSAHATLVSHNAAVHRAIERLVARLVEAARRSPSDPALDAGVSAAVTLLRGHHAYEDELLLPLLARKGAEGPWAEVATEHEQLAALLSRLERAKGATRAELLEQVARLVGPHMNKEEQHLTEAVWAQLLSDDEASAFGKEVAAHSRASLKPATKLLPVLLYNLTPTERAAFTARMPAFVVKGLVPWAFRPAWRGLRPFMTYAPRKLTPG